MDRTQFMHWLARIYATTESELDCDQAQPMLPLLADFEVAKGEPAAHFAPTVAHLVQCPDCAEEYRALLQIATLEAQHRLPSIEASLEQFEAQPTLEEGEPA